MPSLNDGAERITLRIGGVSHDDWLDFEVDSDLQTPADGWSFSVGNVSDTLPEEVQAGARAELRTGDDVIMTGQVDEIVDDIGRGQHTLALYGRDASAVLVDCSAPIFTARDMSLQEVIAQIVKPLGVTAIRIQAEKPLPSKKASIDPGDTAWDALKKAAEASGLWPWVTADGTLVIGGPDYSTPAVDTLVLRKDGQGNNLLRLSVTHNVSARYSEVTVLAQGHGTANADGKHDRRCTVRDTSVPFYRPRIEVVADTDSDEEVQFRARKLMADARLQGFLMTAVVKGLRTAAGQLWEPGQRVQVKSEKHGIDDIYFVMHRRFSGGRGQQLLTTLTLREDGIWLPDAFPKSKRKRKGKGKKGKKDLWNSWEQIDNG
ncbi:phage baseplate assembly protein [Serratia marcescens]|uniref:phage baseplate assembly protein n=1 Tax=Serratia marcescens TaxID=615 RepID=UPI003983B26F